MVTRLLKRIYIPLRHTAWARCFCGACKATLFLLTYSLTIILTLSSSRCLSSDYFRERSFHLAFALACTLVGYIILVSVDPTQQKGVAYFACFCLSTAFSPTCLFHAWHSNDVTDERQRTATIGFLVGSANMAGIPSSLSFKNDTAPRYIPALIVNCVFLGIGIIAALSIGIWLRLDNRRRDKQQGRRLRVEDVPTQDLVGGWEDPNWRWTV